MKTSMLVAAGLLAAAAGSANAAAFLTYLDPAGAREVHYTAPVGNAAFGTLTTTAVVDLQIDLTDHGLGVILFDNLTYSKTAKVGAVTMNGSSFNAEVYDCNFSYTDGANTVLSGSFGVGADDQDGGDLFINGLSGSISSNADAVGGSLAYVFGPAAIQAGNGAATGLTLAQWLATASLAFGDAIDANWTLTGISPRPALLQGGNGQNFLQNFDSNAAFSGTVAIVPTPGTAALAGLGLIMGLPRSRRKA
ncbi:MAG: hypothetical protein J0L61_11950 [Planctomycetes bacterium]|nr:hypothetical protein [Planctomycetota bacterium]